METKEGQVWCKIGVRWLVLHFAGLSSYIKACPQHCRECDKFFIRSQPNIFTYIQGYAHADLLTRVHMHRKDTNVFMLSMISVAQQTYDHLANICHSTLQAVKYTWIYASTHLFLASNARMSPALIYTTHATQLLHSASSFHWRHKQKKGFNTFWYILIQSFHKQKRRVLIHSLLLYATWTDKKTHAHYIYNSDWILERPTLNSNLVNYDRWKGVTNSCTQNNNDSKIKREVFSFFFKLVYQVWQKGGKVAGHIPRSKKFYGNLIPLSSFC